MSVTVGTGGRPDTEILDTRGVWQPIEGLLLEVDQLQVEFRTRDGVARAKGRERSVHRIGRRLPPSKPDIHARGPQHDVPALEIHAMPRPYRRQLIPDAVHCSEINEVRIAPAFRPHQGQRLPRARHCHIK